MRRDTIAIHGHEYRDLEIGAFIVPIYQTAIFEHFDKEGKLRTTDRGTDLKYSREENPTVRALEKLLAKLDSGEDSLCFSSGMSAITTLFIGLLSQRSKVLIIEEVYGTTLQLIMNLRKFGIEVRTVYPDTSCIIEKIDKSYDLVFIETMTNPTLKVIDVREVAKVCKEEGSILAVDNTFVTPVLYRPLEDDVNIVIHSMTKYIAGHNDVIAGVLVSNKDTIIKLWDLSLIHI